MCLAYVQADIGRFARSKPGLFCLGTRPFPDRQTHLRQMGAWGMKATAGAMRARASTELRRAIFLERVVCLLAPHIGQMQ